MNPDTSDRQSQAVYLLLMIVGIVLAIAGWFRLFF
jgi:hypothetical protein